MPPRGKAAAAPKAKAKAASKAKAKAAPKAKAVAKAPAKAKAKAKGRAKKEEPVEEPVVEEPVAAPVETKPKAKRAAKSKPAPPPAAEPTPVPAAAPPAPAAAAAAPSPAKKPKTDGKVVDSRVPGRTTYTVFQDYACKLNQTNIDGGSNNNKFYIIQVLQSSDGSFATWNRWGRVGEDGQNALKKFPAAPQAIADFKAKFKAKTVNNWDNRDSFNKVKGKYGLVETEDVEGDGGDDVPLGRLTEQQIKKGEVVLGQIRNALGGDMHQLQLLTGEFYSLIPHNFGRQKADAINTPGKLEEKEELLKFYLRMGFEEMEKDESLTPIDGVMQQACPKTLFEAAHSVTSKGEIDKSTKKGEALASKQAGKPTKPMDGSLYASIMLYTSNAIYRDLNKALRDENRMKIKKYFTYLRLLFEAMGTLPRHTRKVWRGVSVDLYDEYKVGKLLTWWSVSSTTSDVNVAKGFASGCGGNCTILTIEAKNACDISEITFYSNEKENLLPPGTQLQVVSSEKKGKVTEIHLKEVGQMIMK
eukprot:CAMPEP_0204369044 /NCGR_PEP_ID=MMETSP0469-20131031/44652_1 /ASSEMBLY_ACC=CAM_ASM_000384 /TAXON_ID=2969 /ORGANISM="Oxyrrhis marina" /LENGTH=529 /DNA_ID=CAMNT_0051358707 /DNA_START=12 /DNA_END=1601 /DNA_ORIENTATION=+